MLSKIKDFFTWGNPKPIINKEILRNGKILTENVDILMTVENAFNKLMYTYSINKNEITHNFKLSIDDKIKFVVLTPDKSKFYVETCQNLYQFNMHGIRSNEIKFFLTEKKNGYPIHTSSTVLSHDGRYIATRIDCGFGDDKLKIQSARNYKLLMTWKFESRVTALAFT